MYSCVLTVVIKRICHVVNRGCGSNLKVGGDMASAGSRDRAPGKGVRGGEAPQKLKGF